MLKVQNWLKELLVNYCHQLDLWDRQITLFFDQVQVLFDPYPLSFNLKNTFVCLLLSSSICYPCQLHHLFQFQQVVQIKLLTSSFTLTHILMSFHSNCNYLDFNINLVLMNRLELVASYQRDEMRSHQLFHDYLQWAYQTVVLVSWLLRFLNFQPYLSQLYYYDYCLLFLFGCQCCDFTLIICFHLGNQPLIEAKEHSCYRCHGCTFSEHLLSSFGATCALHHAIRDVLVLGTIKLNIQDHKHLAFPLDLFDHH